MIEKLSQPRTVKTPDGLPVVVTHQAWGHTHQLWNRPEVISYRVLGVVDAKLGFRPVNGTEEYANITGDDYAALLAANKSGKRAGVFRKDDVIALHKKIVAREAVARDAQGKSETATHFAKVAGKRQGRKR